MAKEASPESHNSGKFQGPGSHLFGMKPSRKVMLHLRRGMGLTHHLTAQRKPTPPALTDCIHLAL